MSVIESLELEIKADEQALKIKKQKLHKMRMELQIQVGGSRTTIIRRNTIGAKNDK